MSSSAPYPKWLPLFFSPAGRIPRSTYWLSNIALGVVFVIAFQLLESWFGRTSTLILYPPLFWSLYALAAKRCHDRGFSPLRLLLVLIPVLGPLWWMVALYFRRGTPGENQYGVDPLENHSDYLTVH